MLFALIGFAEGIFLNTGKSSREDHFRESGGKIENLGRVNILSDRDELPDIKDTVYTDMECWLELRVDQQRLYQHWRDGSTETYLISSGNGNGDEKSLESRPGLFAIFHKTAHHKSSQFNSANMYHFMPFNQGIGFHAIDGKAYYAHLGVRPSSHGCIRMKHDDAEKIFSECPLGTLVLVSKGNTARTVAFAPKGFTNEREYSKDEYKQLLAQNLRNLLTGNFFTEKRKVFTIDPKVIPVSGVYNGYDADLPIKQNFPKAGISIVELPDMTECTTGEVIASYHDHPVISAAGDEQEAIKFDKQLVKEYFSNPIGVLPYFGPKAQTSGRTAGR